MARFEVEDIRLHFDQIANEYDAGKKRQSYYYDQLIRIYRQRIPPGAAVLDVGCGTGTILHSIAPGRGVGLDLSPEMIALAQRKFPELEFRVEDIGRPSPREAFDFVMLADVLEHLPDLDAALEGLKSYGDMRTRYICTALNPLWEPIVHLAEALRLKLPEGKHEWISRREFSARLEQHDFVIEESEGRILAPKRVPLMSDAANVLAERWQWLRPLCLIMVIVFRQRASEA